MPLKSLCWLRQLFKLMSLRLKKAAARQEADLMLGRAWYGDLMTLATAQMVHVGQPASSSDAPYSITAAGNTLHMPDSKRRNTTPTASGGKGEGKKPNAPSPSTSAGEEVTIQGDGVTVKVPKSAASWFRPSSPAQVTKFMDSSYNTNGKIFRNVWGRACTNCDLGGKGLVGHNIIKCRQLGNPCFFPCQKCKKMRWTEDCAQ